MNKYNEEGDDQSDMPSIVYFSRVSDKEEEYMVSQELEKLSTFKESAHENNNLMAKKKIEKHELIKILRKLKKTKIRVENLKK